MNNLKKNIDHYMKLKGIKMYSHLLMNIAHKLGIKGQDAYEFAHLVATMNDVESFNSIYDSYYMFFACSYYDVGSCIFADVETNDVEIKALISQLPRFNKY